MIELLYILALLVFLDICSIPIRLNPNGVSKMFRLMRAGYIEKQEIFNPNKIKKILIVGDSTATGAGSIQSQTVAGRLAKKFNATVINLSENGARTREIGKQFEKARNKEFDLVIVHAGNNDVWKMTPLSQLPDDITTLLNKAKKYSKQVILFRGGNIGACPFCPITVGWLYTYRARAIRKMYQKIATEKEVTYIELWMEKNKDIFNTNPKKYYYWDMLHLNGTGFKVWFEYLVTEMKKNNIKI